jgi:electron transfer flavoprotein beta subunit
MKILVCISNVPDTTTKIVFNEDKTQLNKSGVQFIINPYDELALTQALLLTEAAGAGSVTAINVGTIDTETTLRKCLAIGATDAVRIDTDATDGFFVANQIAAYARTQNFDLICTGRESIDYNGGQVGGMLAELLDLPHINVITNIKIQDKIATVERDIDGGRETIETPLPLVVSAQKDLCEPRIPNMRGIMAARTKPLMVLPATHTEARTQVVAHSYPAKKQACKFVTNADELLNLLTQEAKII